MSPYYSDDRQLQFPPQNNWGKMWTFMCCTNIIDNEKKKKTTLLKYAITSEIEKMARTTYLSFWSLEFGNVESHTSSYKQGSPNSKTDRQLSS